MFASGPPHHFVNKFHNNRLLSGGRPFKPFLRFVMIIGYLPPLSYTRSCTHSDKKGFSSSLSECFIHGALEMAQTISVVPETPVYYKLKCWGS